MTSQDRISILNATKRDSLVRSSEVKQTLGSQKFTYSQGQLVAYEDVGIYIPEFNPMSPLYIGPEGSQEERRR